jgi:hypothetical protein
MHHVFSRRCSSSEEDRRHFIKTGRAPKNSKTYCEINFDELVMIYEEMNLFDVMQRSSCTMYAIWSCAFWGALLHFVFDMLTTDNSTGSRQKLKQSVPRYSTNLRRIIWVGSPENRRWTNIWLLRIRRQFDVEDAPTPDQGGRCISPSDYFLALLH